MTLAAILAVVAGLLHAASIATPWDGQPSGALQLVALGILALLLRRSQRPAQGAWLGWLFATSWLCGTFWWMYVAMVTYAGLPGWLAAFAIFALAGVLKRDEATQLFTLNALDWMQLKLAPFQERVDELAADKKTEAYVKRMALDLGEVKRRK